MRNALRRWIKGAVLTGLAVAVQQTGDGSVYAQGGGAPALPPVLPAPPPPAPPYAAGGGMAPSQTPAMPPYSMRSAGPGMSPTAPGLAVPDRYPGGNSTTPSVRPFNAPPVTPEFRPLPINLATALRLANANAWDIGIASQQVRVAAAQLTQANVLWLPTLAMGADYQHHDGPIQNINGTMSNQINRNALELGGAPELTFTFTEAIFEPLAQRQTMAARKADLQTATNDTTFSVAQAYFNVQQARGTLAGLEDTIERMNLTVKRISAMAPEIVPTVENFRARAELENFNQAEYSARENWETASAELARIVRLDPSAVIAPMEPPHLKVTLVAPEQPLDNLLTVALGARPELVSYRALTNAALKRWREEQFRPLLPAVYFRGGESELPDSMMFGAMMGGPNGTFNSFRARTDYEVAMMWEFKNMGLGNAALMRQRRAEYDVTRMRAYQLQDTVAREVVAAYAQVRSSRDRAIRSEQELFQAAESARLNYEGLGTVKLVGNNVRIPVIRPQEAVVSMTALLQAYIHYYGSVADYNRAQFALYRALGNPAQLIPELEQNPESPGHSNPNPAPPGPASPKPPLGSGIVPRGPIAANVPPGSAATGTPACVATGTSTNPGTNPTGAATGTSNPAAGSAVSQAAATSTPTSRAMPAAATDGSSATMMVKLPVNAELYCDGTKMALSGGERTFVTPPLPPGRTYPYEIRIRWVSGDGKPIELTRQVQVQAGQSTLVDFFSR